MGTKLPDSLLATISAGADPGPESLLLLISKLTKVWDTANVKTSCLDVIRGGKRLGLVSITFDADILEQSETTSSTKSSHGGANTIRKVNLTNEPKSLAGTGVTKSIKRRKTNERSSVPHGTQPGRNETP